MGRSSDLPSKPSQQWWAQGLNFQLLDPRPDALTYLGITEEGAEETREVRKSLQRVKKGRVLVGTRLRKSNEWGPQAEEGPG